MKLSIFKTLFLALSAVMMLGLSGCGSSGDPIDDGIGGEPATEMAKLVGIKVSSDSNYVKINESEHYIATAIFNDGTTKDVTSASIWYSSDDTVAIIDTTGKVTGVSEGNATLAAVYEENDIKKVSASKLNVLNVDPIFASLAIEGNDIVLKGGTTQLNAIATAVDGRTYLVNDKVTWTAIPSKYTTIDTHGVVAGNDTGVSLITATAISDTSIKANHDMSVSDIDLKLESIVIKSGIPTEEITSLNLPITTKEHVEAWGIYSDGSSHNINADVVWWSDDQQIASINYFVDSRVYGRDSGETIVTAHFGGIESSIAVTVEPQTNPSLSSINIISRTHGDVGAFDLAAGEKEWVTAFGTYSDGSIVDINSKVAYSSEDPSIAWVLDEVNSNVRARKEADGTTTINVDWQGKNASVEVTVTP